MSHIHIPDGVLPLWLVVAGWLVCLGLLALALRRLSEPAHRRLPLVGVMAALMVVVMTIEIAPLAYHINLSVLAGIVLGPALGLLTAFIVNLLLAFLGHGGITVVGLNTLVMATEMVAGSLLFRGLGRLPLLRPRPGLTAGATTVLALMLGTLAMIGVVALANIEPGWQAPRAAALEPETLQWRNPFGEGILTWEVFPAREEERPHLELGTFARLVFILGSIGWLLEGVITGLVVRYLSRVRPDLLDAGRLVRPAALQRE